jgi:hypothetical protein
LMIRFIDSHMREKRTHVMSSASTLLKCSHKARATIQSVLRR